jgi:threonine-phosphate decarboxylase
MRLPDGLTTKVVCRHMADHGILIRDCSNFKGLSKAYIRISLKSAAHNREVVDRLVQLCGGNSKGRRAHAG